MSVVIKYINNSVTGYYSYIDPILHTVTTATSNSNEVSSELIIPDLNVTKIACTNVVGKNETIGYTLSIVNQTDEDLYDVIVEDDLNQVDYLLGSMKCLINGSPIQLSPIYNNQVLLVTIPVLSGSSNAVITFKVTPKIDLSPQTSLQNSVTVSATYLSNLTNVLYSYADVTLTKLASNTVIKSGSELDYYFTLVNQGDLNATNVVISDLLPSNFKVLSPSINESIYINNQCITAISGVEAALNEGLLMISGLTVNGILTPPVTQVITVKGIVSL